MPDTPTPIALPRCTYCDAYASETITLADGRMSYLCEDHYDHWLATQEDPP